MTLAVFRKKNNNVSLFTYIIIYIVTLMTCDNNDINTGSTYHYPSSFNGYANAFTATTSSSSSSSSVTQAVSPTTTTTIQVNDKLPMVNLHYGFPPQNINTAIYASNKNVLILCLPGAFTPTCSNIQIPGYVKNQDKLKELGIDEILVVSVNDAAVMNAWFMDQKLNFTDSIFLMMGDPYSELTKACGIELTSPIVYEKGLIGPRCKRTAMIVSNNIIQYIAISESDNDPAGDDDPSATCHDAIIEVCQQLQLKKKK